MKTLCFALLQLSSPSSRISTIALCCSLLLSAALCCSLLLRLFCSVKCLRHTWWYSMVLRTFSSILAGAVPYVTLWPDFLFDFFPLLFSIKTFKSPFSTASVNYVEKTPNLTPINGAYSNGQILTVPLGDQKGTHKHANGTVTGSPSPSWGSSLLRAPVFG